MTQTIPHSMRVISTNDEMSRACREAVKPIGLVPTMGALHAGHLSLVDQARADNLTVAVSIFVNPAQFADNDDLEKYPRDLDGDLELLRRHGVDLVYAPTVEEVYPEGFDTWVNVGPLADKLEGIHRLGHFRGVATVARPGLLRPERRPTNDRAPEVGKRPGHGSGSGGDAHHSGFGRSGVEQS